MVTACVTFNALIVYFIDSCGGYIHLSAPKNVCVKIFEEKA